MNRSYFRFVLFGGATALVGCAGDTSGAGVNWDEGADQTKQALEQCDVGLAYNAGNWLEKPLDPGCSLPTATFFFGVASDIPLLLSNLPSSPRPSSIATYGTEEVGDRLGRFFIDRDHSRRWSAGDTSTRFMSSPQVGDQPFIIGAIVKRLNFGPGPNAGGGSSAVGWCVPVLGGPSVPVPLQSVVGIKRGSEWFVDGNGNGTWDGESECDLHSAGFGAASDIPTPVSSTIGVSSGDWGASLVWNFDDDNSWSWSGAPPDRTLTAFGTSTMRPFSDGASRRLGAQIGTRVRLDKNGDRAWNGAPTDIEAPGYLPSSAWRFVGWYSANP